MVNNNLTEIAERPIERQRILKLCIGKLKEDERKEREDKIDVPLIRTILLAKLFGKLSLDGDEEANRHSDVQEEFQNCDSWSWAEEAESEAEEEEKREKLRRQIITAKSFLLLQLQKS